MRRKLIRICWLAASLAAVICSPVVAENALANPTSFVRQVAPILLAKCQGCHGPKKAESNYRLDTFNLLMTPGDFAAAPIDASGPENSQLYQLITTDDAEERMPKNGSRLTDSEIATIGAWLSEGAKFDGTDQAAPLREQIPVDIPHRNAPEKYPAPVPITATAFTNNGEHLVVAGYHELLVWDPAAATLVARVTNIPQRVFGLAFSQDGGWLAVAGGQPGVSGEVRLVPWDGAGPRTGAPPKVLATSEDVFFGVEFRSDGKQVAAGGADGSVRVFDVEKTSQLLRINNHADWVTDVCFAPDGTRIATASRDKTAKVFEAESGKLLATFTEHQAPVRAIAFSPDGKNVLSAGGNRLRIWNVEDARQLGELTGFSADVQALAVCAETVLGGSADKSARQFKLADRAFIRAFKQPAEVLSLACHPGTERLSVGCFDGSVSVWNAKSGDMIQQFLAVPLAGAPKN